MVPALSFQGDSSISFEQQELHLKDGVLRTPASVINYRGTVSFSGAYRLELDLLSQQSDELLTLAGYTEIPKRFLDQDSIDLKGPTRISGTLEGGSNPFGLRGTVRSERIFFRDEVNRKIGVKMISKIGFIILTPIFLSISPNWKRPSSALISRKVVSL